MLSEWVELALETKGMSQAALGRELTIRLGRSIDRAAINKMVTGKRAIAADEMLVISQVTGVPAPVEQHVPKRRLVPLIGFVSAGAEANLFGEGQGPFDEVEPPDGSTEKTVAVEIRGDSLGPILNGWRVFYDDVYEPSRPELLNELCVIGLDDGRILVKKLTKGQLAGRYTLLSNAEPPIYDEAVNWAAPVRGILPKR